MILANKFTSVRRRCRILCFLISLFIVIQILWTHNTYHYIATRIVAMSAFEVIKTDSRVDSSTPSSNLKSTNKLKLVRKIRIEKIVDSRNNLHDDRSVLKTVQKSVVAQSNVSKTQPLQQKDECRNNTDICQELKRRQLSKIYGQILEHFRLRRNDKKDNFVNLHRYGYHLDSTACRQESDVVILVHSKFDHFDKRALIRDSWAFNRTINGITFSTVFFLGEPNIPEIRVKRNLFEKQANAWMEGQRSQLDTTRKLIYKEASLFGDIVMGNFTDTYRNLTIKHIMALRWVVSCCPQVVYVVKVDDDVVVNTYSIGKYVTERGRNNTRLLTCKIPYTLVPQRSPRTKWYVNETEYPFSVFPPWCLGFGVLMTRDVAEKLLMMSRDVRSFWIDDVYVTGLLRHKARLPVHSMTTRFPKYKAFFVLQKFIRNQTVMSYWNQLVANNTHPLA